MQPTGPGQFSGRVFGIGVLTGAALLLLVAVCVGGAALIVRSQLNGRTPAPPPTATSPNAPATQSSAAASPTAVAPDAVAACAYPQRDASTQQPAPAPPGTATRGPQRMTITTNRGVIEIRLLAQAAPCSVNALRTLAEAGYYDGTRCHRLVDSGMFVLQCGDPNGDGSGAPGWQYANENVPGAGGTAYPRGSVALANAGPDTNGSQFFISYRDNDIAPNFPVVGEVVRGLEIVEAVARGRHDNRYAEAGGGMPRQALTFTSVVVTD